MRCELTLVAAGLQEERCRICVFVIIGWSANVFCADRDWAGLSRVARASSRVQAIALRKSPNDGTLPSCCAL